MGDPHFTRQDTCQDPTGSPEVGEPGSNECPRVPVTHLDLGALIPSSPSGALYGLPLWPLSPFTQQTLGPYYRSDIVLGVQATSVTKAAKTHSPVELTLPV